MGKKPRRSLAQWFGETRYVRILLLAALLTLGVIHIEFLVNAVIYLWRIAKPLILGAAMAYILEIVFVRVETDLFSRFKNEWIVKNKRWISVVITAFFLLALLFLFCFVVFPGLTEAVTLLANALPDNFQNLKTWVLETFRDVPTVTNYVQEIEFDWNTFQARLINWAINGIGGKSLLSSTVSVIGAVAGSVANFLISLIFALFLLTSKKQLQRQFKRLMNAALKERPRMHTQRVLDIANRCFSGFIMGQTINGLILGILTWLGMQIFRMPYALIVAVLSGTTALVPIVGGYIGAILGTFLVFTAAPGQALWFLLFIFALQTFQGNVIYPHLLGSNVGLPSLWVLAAVSIGGGLGGVGGMLVAVPITATAYALISDWVRQRETETYYTDDPENIVEHDQIETVSEQLVSGCKTDDAV